MGKLIDVDMLKFPNIAIFNMKLHGANVPMVRLIDLQMLVPAADVAPAAKVLTLQTPEAEWRDRVLYLEQRNKKDIEPCMLYDVRDKRMFGKDQRFIQFLLLGRADPLGFIFENCGKKWRCWTAQPTDERRKGTPWID